MLRWKMNPVSFRIFQDMREAFNFHPEIHQAIEKIQLDFLNNNKTLCLFDIDSSLVTVKLRTETILKEFAKNSGHKEKYGETCQQLNYVKVEEHDWGIKSALIRHQVVASLDFFESLRHFWMKHFFSGDYLHHDQPYSGAVELARTISKSCHRLIYLTGRDEQRMGAATRMTLKELKFPTEGKHITWGLKQDLNQTDVDHKVSFIQHILPDFDSIWFFENEPVIINRVHRLFPQVNIIHIDTTHSGQETPPDHIPSVKPPFKF